MSTLILRKTVQIQLDTIGGLLSVALWELAKAVRDKSPLQTRLEEEVLRLRYHHATYLPYYTEIMEGWYRYHPEDRNGSVAYTWIKKGT